MSTDGVIYRYPKVWETLKFNNSQLFTKPRDPYVPSLVREFYDTYNKVVLKNKSRVKSLLKPLDVVKIWGVQIPCSPTKTRISWDV